MPLAEDDLETLALHVAREGGRPIAAEKVVRDIKARCDGYAEHPMMGEACASIAPDVRRFTVKRWVVFYRPTEDGIVVLRIVDGARDISRLFTQ